MMRIVFLSIVVYNDVIPRIGTTLGSRLAPVLAAIQSEYRPPHTINFATETLYFDESTTL